MTAVVLPQGKQQFFTTAGVPAVGYKLATFDAGTTNPKTTWLDAGQVGANTNPIILDARGEAVIFWNGAYKVQLQDSTGAVIWTVDVVTTLLGTINQSLIPGADNTYDLGSTAFSWRNLYLGVNHSPLLDTVNNNLAYYARTPAETASSTVPTAFSYPADDPRRSNLYPNRGWLNLGHVPTWINSTAPGGSFSVVGDQTAIYVKARRVRLINADASSSDVRITFSSFAAGVTTINVTTAETGGGVISATIVAVEVQDTCPAYGAITNVVNVAGSGVGAQFINTNVGVASSSRILIGNFATDGVGAPDILVSSAVAIVATSGNFVGSYLNNGLAGVPTGRGIWYHTGFQIPLIFGTGDQVRLVLNTGTSAALVFGADECMRFISPRVDDLGGAFLSFYEDDAATRKGLAGFGNGGVNNTMEFTNEKANSNTKITATQHVWLAKGTGVNNAIYVDAAANMSINTGAGNPNGVVTANPGSDYFNSSGGAAVSKYVKEAGVGTNVNWVAK